MSRSVTVTLYGGLGNQLFQFCYGLRLSHEWNQRVKFSTVGLERWSRKDLCGRYSIEQLIRDDERSQLTSMMRLAAQRVAGLIPTFWLSADTPEENIRDSPTKHTKFVSGYFQSLENAEWAWPQLERRINQASKNWPRALDEPARRIAVHIRLGDYRSSSSVRRVHGLTQSSYYVKAVQIAASRCNLESILLVSDEPSAAEELLGPSLKKQFRVIVSEGGSTDIEDLALLASSSAVVGSNSSFSWWASFLATKFHQSLVILPHPWYASSTLTTTGLFKDSWVRVEREYSAI